MEELLKEFTTFYSQWLGGYRKEEAEREKEGQRGIFQFVEEFRLFVLNSSGTLFKSSPYGRSFLALAECPAQAEQFLLDMCPSHILEALRAIGEQAQLPGEYRGLEPALMKAGFISEAPNGSLSLTERGQKAWTNSELSPQRIGAGKVVLEQLTVIKIGLDSEIAFDGSEEALRLLESDFAQETNASGYVLIQARDAIAQARERMYLRAATNLLGPLKWLAASVAEDAGLPVEETEVKTALLDCLDKLSIGRTVLSRKFVSLMKTVFRSLDDNSDLIGSDDICSQAFFGYPVYEAVFTCFRELLFCEMEQ